MARKVQYRVSLELPVNPADGLSVDLYSNLPFDVDELYRFPQTISFCYDLASVAHQLLDGNSELTRVDVKGVRQSVIIDAE